MVNILAAIEIALSAIDENKKKYTKNDIIIKNCGTEYLNALYSANEVRKLSESDNNLRKLANVLRQNPDFYEKLEKLMGKMV